MRQPTLPMNPLRKWMFAHTADEVQKLADMADTTRANVYHMGANRRTPSLDMAQRLVAAMVKIDPSTSLEPLKLARAIQKRVTSRKADPALA